MNFSIDKTSCFPWKKLKKMYGANFHDKSQRITLKPKPVNNKFNIDIYIYIYITPRFSLKAYSIKLGQ